MHQSLGKLLIATFMFLTCGCRPVVRSSLYDNATMQSNVGVTFANGVTALRSQGSVKISAVDRIAVAREVTDEFALSYENRFLTLSSADKVEFEVDITLDSTKKCKTISGNSASLLHGSTVNLSCVTGVELLGELKAGCEALAIDQSVAVYDATKDYCTCRSVSNGSVSNDPSRQIFYSQFTGRLSQFTATCKAVATALDLRKFCTDIKVRQCPTCTVSENSCTCPTKATVEFAKYINQPDRFFETCELKQNAASSGDYPSSLKTAVVGRMLDINRSADDKTPCTVFPFGKNIVTAGHCIMTPEKISEIVIEFGTQKGSVVKVLGRDYGSQRDFAVLQTNLSLPTEFKLGNFNTIPEVLYLVGYPMEPGIAGSIGVTKEQKHEHFTKGTTNRWLAKCKMIQDINATTFSASCDKQIEHIGPWAGFSGAPLVNPDTNEVFGIMNSMGNGDDRANFTKVSASQQ